MADSVPGPGALLVGRWRIAEMDGWDRDAIDLVEPAYIQFARDGTGQFAFIAVLGFLDSRPFERDGRVGVEFTWAGDEEGDPVSGRGWAVRLDDKTIEGHVFFHLGEDSSFRAELLGAGDSADGQ